MNIWLSHNIMINNVFKIKVNNKALQWNHSILVAHALKHIKNSVLEVYSYNQVLRVLYISNFIIFSLFAYIKIARVKIKFGYIMWVFSICCRETKYMYYYRTLSELSNRKTFNSLSWHVETRRYQKHMLVTTCPLSR